MDEKQKRHIGDTFIQLYFRWEDEKEYEDLEDYQNVFVQVISDMGLKADNVQLSENFHLYVDIEKISYHFYVSKNNLYFAEIPL